MLFYLLFPVLLFTPPCWLTFDMFSFVLRYQPSSQRWMVSLPPCTEPSSYWRSTARSYQSRHHNCSMPHPVDGTTWKPRYHWLNRDLDQEFRRSQSELLRYVADRTGKINYWFDACIKSQVIFCQLNMDFFLILGNCALVVSNRYQISILIVKSAFYRSSHTLWGQCNETTLNI